MPGSTEIHPGYQAQFHRRWGHLEDPHVRALAWLLDAPDLLDANAPEWQGRIATLGPLDQHAASWLQELDHDPADLHASLDLKPLTRLGRYAERLLAYYLRYQGRLVAHGVQVRAQGVNRGGTHDTIGEFDFLVRSDDARLLHWEFATKLYLLEADGHGSQADYFVGPGLADTLGAKIRKIMDHQLALSTHPAAQDFLPEPVAAAQALVKGWLFYQGGTPRPAQLHGVSGAHCRGFWCTVAEFDDLGDIAGLILPRLAWLAPARCPQEQVLDRQALRHALQMHFAGSSMPVLMAVMVENESGMIEVDRGFIVPDDWRERAQARARNREAGEA